MQIRKEEKLQKELIGKPDQKTPPRGFTLQGCYAEKTSDRFKAGRPDLRIGHQKFGQLDAELKYIDWPLASAQNAREIDVGLTKLQWLHIRRMNEHGIPAICLTYIEALDEFYITTERVLRAPLTSWRWRVMKLPSPKLIDVEELFITSREYLYHAGYR